MNNVIVDKVRCKGCGYCAAYCPKKVFDITKEVKSEAIRMQDCIACLLCEKICPDFAIVVEVAK